MTTNCLRCNLPCQTGTPDPKARAIRKSDTTGLCADCMITKFMLSIDPIRNIIEGTPARGDVVAARPGKGPQILLAEHIQKGFIAILGHTQLREDEIKWARVIDNWNLPWPRGLEPKPGNF